MTTLRPLDPYRKSSIQIEKNDLSSNDNGVKQRIDRIATNYQRLSQKLTEIETLMMGDETLLAIDARSGSSATGDPSDSPCEKRRLPTRIPNSSRTKNQTRMSDGIVTNGSRAETNRQKKRGLKATEKAPATPSEKGHPHKPR